MKHMFVSNGDGWWLKISDIDHLTDYINNVWVRRKNSAIQDYENICKISQGFEGEKFRYVTHSSNELSRFLGVSCDLLKIPFELNITLVELEMIKTMLEILEEDNSIYINEVGGYCCNLPNRFEDGKPNEVYEKENPDFPIFDYKDITIKVWEGGKHYYTYLGDMPVYVNGKYKYDTHDEAEKAAKKAVNQSKRNSMSNSFVTGGDEDSRKVLKEKLKVAEGENEQR